jgi:ABC-type transporter Mla subunit MlaD
MPEINYGRIALIPKGDYSETTQYRQGDVVTYENASYICKAKPEIGTVPTNTTYWQVAVSATEVLKKVDAKISSSISSATSAANEANAAAKACEGIVDGLNTMVDTVTGKSCVLGVEDGILVIKEA